MRSEVKNMKKKMLSCLVLSCVFAAGALAGCGGQGKEDKGEVSLSLFVQCETVVLGERNAFVVTAENLDEDELITYSVKQGEGAFQTVATTSERILAYPCEETGSFTVQASVQSGAYATQQLTFSVVEGGGETFGDAVTGELATTGVDLLGDFGDTPSIEHKSLEKISDEYAFVKGVNATQFVLTATVDIVGANFNDPNPKTGLFCKAGQQMWYFAFDVKPDFSKDEVVFVNYQGSWQWPGRVFNAKGLTFRVGERRIVNKMTLLRDGETFYLLVNDVLLGSVRASGFTQETVVGTYTMAQNAIFSEYSCYVGGTAEYAAALAKVKA